MHALTEVTRLLEKADDPVGPQGSGDLLDDFVAAAATRVLSSCNFGTTSGLHAPSACYHVSMGIHVFPGTPCGCEQLNPMWR